MSNDLTTAGDGFGVPENSGNQFIIGKMIKFADGEYIVDKTAPLPTDIELVALGVVTAWVHWQDGKPIEHRVTRDGQMHPDRDDLPDQDEADWPPGLDGEPADPLAAC